MNVECGAFSPDWMRNVVRRYKWKGKRVRRTFSLKKSKNTQNGTLLTVDISLLKIFLEKKQFCEFYFGQKGTMPNLLLTLHKLCLKYNHILSLRIYSHEDGDGGKRSKKKLKVKYFKWTRENLFFTTW